LTRFPKKALLYGLTSMERTSGNRNRVVEKFAVLQSSQQLQIAVVGFATTTIVAVAGGQPTGKPPAKHGSRGLGRAVGQERALRGLEVFELLPDRARLVPEKVQLALECADPSFTTVLVG